MKHRIRAALLAPIAFACASHERWDPEAYCDGVDAFVAEWAEDGRLFGRVSACAEPGAEGEWREFASIEDRDGAFTGANLCETAIAWTRDGRVVRVRSVYEPPSGDWVHTVDRCFGPDGYAERTRAVLLTHYNNFMVTNVQRRPADGVATNRREIMHFLLDGPEPDIAEQTVPPVERVADLPFAALLD